MVWAIHLRIGLEDPSGPLSTSSSEYSVIQRLKQSNREKPAQIHHTALQPHHHYEELSLASHDHTGPSPFFSFKSRWTPPCRTCEGGGINLHPLHCPSPIPHPGSSSPAPALWAGLSTGHRMGEGCVNIHLAKVFLGHNPRVTQNGGFPWKACCCQHGRSEDWSWLVQSKGNWEKTGPDNSSMCLATPAIQHSVRGDWYYSGWQFFFYFFFFLHLNGSLTSPLKFLTEKSGAFSSKLLRHRFLLFESPYGQINWE